MDTTTLTIVMVGANRTRLLARLVTYVAGRGLEMHRIDFDDHTDHSTLLLRVSGASEHLAVVSRQLERLVGVESAGRRPARTDAHPAA